MSARLLPSPRMITRSTVGISCARPTPSSERFVLTRSTMAPSWIPTPSSVRTTRPPPSDVAAVVSARCAARVVVAQTSEKASDSTTVVTVCDTRPRRPSAAGAWRRPSACAARGGRPRPAMPSNTLSVSASKSTCALIASTVSSMMRPCTAGSSTSGARVATKASSSTSWSRAQPVTIETGTRIVAMTMKRAESSPRHHPCLAVAGRPASASRAFSASRIRTRSARLATSGSAVAASICVMSPLSRECGPQVGSAAKDHPIGLTGRAIRRRAGPRPPCRERRRRRPGSARTPCCGGAATCGRRAGGRS